MTSCRPKIKIFVTDYDGCAFTTTSARPDALSPHLVDIANNKNNNYAAMYGCTHRTYAGYREDKFMSFWITRFVRALGNFSANNFMATYITKNLESATGLNCLAVSTPDDHAFSGSHAEKCGKGYSNILRSYELELINNNDLVKVAAGEGYKDHDLVTAFPFYTWKELIKRKHVEDKNKQLVQIAHHAVLIYGKDVDIELDFFDDLEINCSQVTKITGCLLPPNVKIRSFRHFPQDGIFASVDRPFAVVSRDGPSSTSLISWMLGGLGFSVAVVEEAEIELEQEVAGEDVLALSDLEEALDLVIGSQMTVTVPTLR